MSVFSSFPGLARRAEEASIALPPRVADLAQSFPLLFFMLASDTGSFARRLEIFRRVEEGQSLTDIAAAYRLPICLRRIRPESCVHSLPWLDWSSAAGPQLVNHIPEPPVEAANWLVSVFQAVRFCNEEFGLWVAHQRGLFTRAPLDHRLLQIVALYAWHSNVHDGPLAAINTVPWSPKFGLTRALDQTEAWLNRLHVLAFCGSYPISDTWLQAGTVGSFDFLPITTYEQLMAERFAMRNCLHTYVDKLVTGACRLFAVKVGQLSVATLEVVADTNGRLRIAQLKGPGNAKAPDELHTAAQTWADRQRRQPLPIAKRTTPSQAVARLQDWMGPYRLATVPTEAAIVGPTTLKEQFATLRRNLAGSLRASSVVPGATQREHAEGGLTPFSPEEQYRIRAELTARLGNQVFDSWFLRLELDGHAHGIVHARVPVPFLRRWILTHYIDDVRLCCASVQPDIRAVDLQCSQFPPWAEPQPPVALWDALHGDATHDPGRIRIDRILALVSERYGLSRADLLSPRRHRDVVRARQIGIYLARQLTGRGLPEIGRRFGDRDHTTVLHAIRRIESLMAGDHDFRDEVEALRRIAIASFQQQTPR